MSLKNHEYPRKDDKISMTIEDVIKALMRMEPEVIHIEEMSENAKEMKSNLHEKKRFKF